MIASEAFWYAICNDKPHFKSLIHRLTTRHIYWPDLLNELEDFLKVVPNNREGTLMTLPSKDYSTDTLDHSQNFIVLNDVRVREAISLIITKRYEIQSALSLVICSETDLYKDIGDMISEYL